MILKSMCHTMPTSVKTIDKSVANTKSIWVTVFGKSIQSTQIIKYDIN